MSFDRLVLDSGVAIAWVFPETEDERLYAASVLRFIVEEGVKVFVPPLFHIEVGEFLLRRRRTKLARYSQRRMLETLEDLDGLGISTVVTPVTYRNIIEWGQGYHVQGKDAPFIQLAKENSLPLATIDGGQIKAANVFGIDLIRFS